MGKKKGDATEKTGLTTGTQRENKLVSTARTFWNTGAKPFVYVGSKIKEAATGTVARDPILDQPSSPSPGNSSE